MKITLLENYKAQKVKGAMVLSSELSQLQANLVLHTLASCGASAVPGCLSSG